MRLYLETVALYALPPISIYVFLSFRVHVVVYLLSRIRQRHECECREPVVSDVLLTPAGRESD